MVGGHRVEKITEKSSGGESGHPLAKPKPQEEPSSGSGSMGSMTVEHRLSQVKVTPG